MKSPAHELLRNFRIVRHLVTTSIQAQTQYRFDFLLQMTLAFFWVGWNVAPLWLVFQIRTDIAGWRFEEAMLVMSAFLVLKALLEGLITPNLTALVQHIRTGTFDFMLLKPVDSQLMASSSRVVPTKIVDLLGALGIAVWSISRLEVRPGPVELLAGVGMLAAGVVCIYAIWVAIVCTAFWFVKVDNLSFLFTSIFDAARWPISIFRGWIRVVLTFALPIALMTSYPALAVLGRLEARTALIAWTTAAVLFLASRAVWQWAVSHYASASS